MKTWVFLILALFVAACQNGDGGGNGAVTTPVTTVTTPLTSCIDGSTYCNPSIYNTYGFRPYPGLYGYAYNYMSTFAQRGFCNCPAGTQPIYNNTYGLGCIESRLLARYSGFYLNWQFNSGSSWTTGYGYAYSYNGYTAPTIPNNYPQYSNIPAGYYGGYNGGACSRNLTQSCLIDQANTCGNGATCRQVIAGSNLGVCAN